MISKAVYGALDIAREDTTTTSTSTTTINPDDPITLEGFGALAGGANTGTIYTVTQLSGTGAGTLAYGLGIGGAGSTSPTGKTIVFAVAGTINQRHTVNSGNHFTIDGTTAPYPGITITTSGGDGLAFEGSVHHVIVKGITAINCSNDGIAVNEACNNILITNCTAYGNLDGNIDVGATDGDHITVQWCIIGNHNGADGNTGGTLVTSRFVSIHHNLYFPISPNPAEGERFPFVHCNYSPVSDPNCDIRNNLVWQYGRNNATGSGFGAGLGYGAHGNIVNNYYKTTSSAAAADGIDLSIDGTTSSAYSAGNVSGNGINFNTGSRYTNHAEFPIPVEYQITPESACAAASRILSKAGITQRNPIGGGRRADENAYITGVTVLTGC